MTTEAKELMLLIREDELMRRYALKCKIAENNGENQVKIDTQKKMLELEEFAIWRERHLREELKIENPKASDLRRFSITNWRKNKEGKIAKRLSTKEKLEAEIREWKELELNNVN